MRFWKNLPYQYFTDEYTVDQTRNAFIAWYQEVRRDYSQLSEVYKNLPKEETYYLLDTIVHDMWHQLEFRFYPRTKAFPYTKETFKFGKDARETTFALLAMYSAIENLKLRGLWRDEIALGKK